MSSASVAIELLSDRMDVAAVKSVRVVSSRRISLALPSEATAWAKAVRSSTDALREVVKELDVAGSSTRLVYRSPTQAVDLASFDLRTSGQACAAALLPAAEALPYAVNAAVIEAVAVGRDHRSTERRWHVVVAADRIDVARALAELVESADLAFDSATPIDAAIMARLVRRALQFDGAQHGWLHFGRHSSFFVLGGGGRVRFERSIGLGVETIVQSLTRPIRMPDEEPIELSYETAKRIFHEHGIPDTDEALDKDHGLTRRHIMPQIQPVLQRYVVELRQSLRFGLSEDERKSIEITVSGPGSAIPGLTELIAWELKLSFGADPQYANYDHSAPAGSGSELIDSVEDRAFLNRMNLQPPESIQRRQIGDLRRWLWLGAAAALAVVAFNGLRLHGRLGDARGQAVALKQAAVEFKMLAKTHKELVGAVEAMNALEKTITAEVGTRPDLRAILQELSRLTPKSVQLSSMRFSREEDVFVARLYGRAAKSDEATEETGLKPFIEALKGSPLFRNAVLRNVQLGAVEGGVGQRFEATFEAVAAPVINDAPSLAVGERGHGQ